MYPPDNSENLGPYSHTKVKRLADRAHYDRDSIYRILDEGFVCHLGFIANGTPYVIPTGYGRRGDALYLHGASANFALAESKKNATVSVTVTLIDGLVLSKSAFHHSINYRSVVSFGTVMPVEDVEEKKLALETILNHIVPNRSNDTRPPSRSELKATRVVRYEIMEASAKIRIGEPKEEPEDIELDYWSGQIPIEWGYSDPIPSGNSNGKLPDYLVNFSRPANS
ncbi:MAG: pyridoxamine 5'-phosphate oxidase family protein [Acidimicrobiales bacterium]|nr:pyridoxamine 5'-phosphate oxidase family protein [Acidimicrobiales bacterium]